MRNFSFNQTENSEERDIEKILRQRKRKIFKQQLIYTIILAAIIGVICVWLYRKSVYVEFDGYVSVDFYTFRTDEDVFFLDSKWRVGDLILPGDTVFSYVIANNFYKHESNDYEPTIIVRDRDMKTQYGLTRQDLNVLQVRINELQRQLAVEDHNIKLGLSTNHNKLRTEQELSEAREQYRALRQKLNVLWNAIAEGQESVQRLTNNGHGYLRVSDMRNLKLLDSLGVVRYAIAADSSIVTEKLVPTYSLVLRGEPIITSQGLNLADNNVSVIAYVKPDQMQYINYHTNATVIVNDQISYNASVLMLGARTEEIPGELRSTLSRDHTASVVVFSIDPDQDIPFWSLINGLPVTIRINKFREGTSEIDDYIVFNTTYGIDPKSMKRWRDNKETGQDWNDHSHATQADTTSAAGSIAPVATSAQPKEPKASPLTSSAKPENSKTASSKTKSEAPKTKSETVKPKPETAKSKPSTTKAKNEAPKTANKTALPDAKSVSPASVSASTMPLAAVKQATQGKHYVIVGSTPDRGYADKLVAELRKKGFKGARIIPGDGGRARIAIASFASRSDAEAAISRLAKETTYKSAWISNQ